MTTEQKYQKNVQFLWRAKTKKKNTNVTSLETRAEVVWPFKDTRKNNGFPFLDILGYLKNTHKNPKFGKVRQIPTREFPTKFPNWDLSHFAKIGIFIGIL